ncbi:MAG: SDR family NAD(P)-dependent oxidoreductase [Solirubrobacterales bacterium]
METNVEKLREYLRRAAVDLEEKNRQLGELRARSREPIAIVGMSCRYPGGVDSPEALWRLVAERTDAISPFPTDRGWDLEALYHPDPDHPGTCHTREGGFLPDAADFDAEFFGISPREALAMDPQQRLLLEACWEALEHARINPEGLRGSQAGVYAGAIQYQYGAGSAIPPDLEGYLGTGTTASVLSGRIAYALGLTGAAVTVDTACSSSLVAIHQAAGALRGGECSLALAGGVTVLSTPGIFIEFSRQRVLAPDGRSKAFAAAADGAGWSEGVGMLVLERLSDAQARGHRVLATIRGSAINQDGASNGLTAPNGPSQERVIRRALAGAHLGPADIEAVEAHGTGTNLGDPIEARALLAVYGQERGDRGPLRLGSIKSNLGHAQAAAGVAGVIKMVEALRHEELPATINLDRPSPHVDWDSGEVELLGEPCGWRRDGRPRRAGVSSFGISGTNAHVIIEEAPEPAVGAEEENAPALTGPLPFLLSAKSEPALRDAGARLAARLREQPDADLADVAWSLARTRASFEHRAVSLAEERDDLLEALDALSGGLPAPNLVTGRAEARHKLGFVFPGQGSQWPGMATELLDSSPVFAAAMAECEKALAPHLDWSPAAVLRHEEGAPSPDRVDVVQPLLFAVMVSLGRLWRAFGVEPAAVVGHSQGEIAAAHVAGAIPLEDAARLVALRGAALADELAGRGGMVSVAASATEAARMIEPFSGRVSLAAVNGPASVVVSGDPEALEELLTICASEGVRAKRIPVDYAAHSEQVEAIRERLEDGVAGLVARPGDVPFISAVTGDPVAGEELDGPYWFRNLRETVLFEGATRALLDDSFSAFIEVSPHPVLTMAVTESAEAGGADPGAVVAISTLRRHQGGPARFLASLAEAHVEGVDVDWKPLFDGSRRRHVDLPTYPFQRSRFWLEGGYGAGDVAAAGLAATGHPLLGAEVELAEGEGRLFTGRISTEAHTWLADHAVMGTVLLPGTAFLELALHAGGRVGLSTVEELVLRAPLILSARGSVQIQVSLGPPEEDGRRTVAIHSRPDLGQAERDREGEWALHASGRLAPVEAPVGPMPEPWPPRDAEPLEVEGLYDRLAAAGFEYGPAFQGLTAAWRRGDEILAEVSPADLGQRDEASFAIHPALLDAALHAAVAAFHDLDGPIAAAVPFAWEGVSVHGEDPGALRVRITPTKGAEEASRTAISVQLADAAGAPVGTVRSLVTRPLSEADLPAGGHPESLFRLDWVDMETADAAPLEPVPMTRLDDGDGPPPTLLLDTGSPGRAGGDLPAAAHAALHGALATVQEFLSSERLAASNLVVVTHGAIATRPGEALADLPAAPIWGLVRSAQSEHPGRLLLVDSDDDPASMAALAAAVGHAVALGEPQLALREGRPSVPRLVRAGKGAPLAPPADSPAWRLEADATGTLEGLALAPCEEAAAPPGPGQVRVELRAAGLNFRDVLIALGIYPDPAVLGGEGAGVVAEVGPGVLDLAVGDRVLGLLPGAFGSMAVTDARLLAKIPDGSSFTEAAALPIASLTAAYALRDVARLEPGERLLVHAAAGGVGITAVRLAVRMGAEVFATAHPGKWDVLEAMGLDRDHIASSRDIGFKGKFLARTGGEGMDVVLDSLAGDLVDASLDLLPRGGRFVEMGKVDVRDPDAVATSHPGVVYRAFELAEVGPDRIAELLAEAAGRLGGGEPESLPLTFFDLRRAPEAFRLMRESRHVGKIVFTVPRPADPGGTVLITGGTGAIGALLARHLAEKGAGNLVLASRGGPEAEGAAELRAELQALGAEVTIAACDVGDREQLAAVMAAIPAAHPLRTVVHAAGALDDGAIGSLDRGRLDAVLGPKADAAWHLHELTSGIDLDAFVMFSSAASTVGAPGQGNYAAANAFLDALAARRRAEGLPATSLAWGFWAEPGGLTGDLAEADLERLRRAGVGALPSSEGLALFDAAEGAADPLMLPIRLEIPRLRAAARSGMMPPLLRGLLGRGDRRPTAGRGSLARTLSETPEGEREKLVLDIVTAAVAVVLAHSSGEAIDPARNFKDLGFDSLSAVELRNRLADATGLRLAASLVFDHPTPTRVAAFLREQAEGEAVGLHGQMRTTVRADEPIAIVGMSCRYPGGVSSPEELWRLLSEGADAVGRFPGDRGWDVERLLDPELSRPGTTYVGEGAFLEGAGEFDAAFFGIGPREALAMDPQQRLLLEGAWEALEDAGVDPASLRGSRTGVYAGIIAGDYGLLSRGSRGDLEGYLGIGNTASVASGRIAYTLGLEGPALSFDSACSSSLVAIHLACQALRQGECSLALAGGVTVMSTPASIVELSRQRALAPDGRCKAFGSGADGMGTSEGMGLVVLEPLSMARLHGHEVLATVRGSAVNQDGASNGLTAPNGPAQERVIAAALASAGLSAAEIDAVEAHGTGTALGDPIEAGALLATYGQGREHGPLRLGSIKSNIGHAQAAAGVAGVIKMVEAMRHGVLPRTLHADPPSGHVDWGAGEIELLTEEAPWGPTGRPRRAGVSSFGISGTNAHLILEEPPAGEPAAATEEPAPLSGAVGLALSARSAPALRRQARELSAHLRAHPELEPADVSFSLATARGLLDHRAVITGVDREDLLAGLDGFGSGEGEVGAAVTGEPVGPVFLLTGQGAQRVRMGSGLREVSPAFAAAFDEVCAAFDPLLARPLAEVIVEGGESLDDTTFAQPALFAIEVALARLVGSLGLRPAALVGHSIGELAAAHLAEVLSLADACTLVAARGRLMGALPAGGAMVAIEAGEAEVAAAVEGTEGAALAAVNGPVAVVVSGAEAEVLAVAARFAEDGRRTRRLVVSHAFHSPLIDPMLEEFESTVRGLAFSPPTVPVVSTLSGRLLTDAEATDPAYWVGQARGTVRFAAAVATAAGLGHSLFVELGPDPVLCAAAAGCLDGEATLIPTLDGGREEPTAILDALAGAHAAGVRVDWAALVPGASRVPLPTYPFQRQRFWLAAEADGDPRAVGQDRVDHPFLGAAVELPGDEGLLLTGRISPGSHPWLADHAVLGTTILPGTALLELARRGGEEAGLGTLRELTLQAPAIVPDEGALALQVRVGAGEEDGSRPVTVSTRPPGEDGEWTVNASGTVGPGAPAEVDPPIAWPPEGAEPVALDGLYARLAEAGVDHGPVFRGVTVAWCRGEEVFVEASLDEDLRGDGGGFGLHPALLDAAFHPALALADPDGDSSGAPWLPFSFSGVSPGPGDARSLRVRVARGPKAGEISLDARDRTGEPVIRIDSLLTRPVDPATFGASSTDGLHSLDWCEPTATEPDGDDPRIVLFELRRADEDGGEPTPGAVRFLTETLLSRLRSFLAADEGDGSRLVVLTRGALAVGLGETPEPATAAALGLLASAAAEHPGRIASIDLDRETAEAPAEALALAGAESRLAVRDGRVLVPRLRPRPDARGGEEAEARHLGTRRRGTLEDLAWLPSTAATRPLGPTEVRVSVRAAGLNFRDVLLALDIYPGEAPIGSEGAGTVIEVGAEVWGLAVGDRVTGMMAESISPLAVAEEGSLTRLPEGWTFAEGAALPISFATAWYGLVDLAGLAEGESVLIHAGAGGVGMAAIQISRMLGARVLATASGWKWPVLRALGVAAEDISGSRDLGFVERVRAATGGRGVDVVLNSLAGEFVDASASLLVEGGRLLEIGKTDLRDRADLPPGISYIPFDTTEAGPGRLTAILAEATTLAEDGLINPPAIEHADVDRPEEAFRHLREGHNIGKLVFDLPAPPDPGRTVLVTGAPGGLGSLVARHLVERGARHLVLASRQGPGAEGAAELRADLEAASATVEIHSCDVADAMAVEELVAGIGPGHPLGTVIHCAGVRGDAMVSNLDPGDLEQVLAPKADGAWNLHRATAGLDLERFVLFSSVAGVLGGPGQGAYAAANSYLDALAQARRAEGLPATSIAWGMWNVGMGAGLTAADRERISRGGLAPIATEDGLAMLDRALASPASLVVAAPTDAAALRRLAAADLLSPALRELVCAPRRAGGASASRGDLAARLAAVPEAGREAVVLALVAEHVAAVLGHSSAEAVDPDRAFRDLGFDSLAAVELRNRLGAATGLKLAPTLVFDHPNAREVAAHLLAGSVAEPGGEEGGLWEAFDRLKAMLDLLPTDEVEARAAARGRLTSYLEQLVPLPGGDGDGEGAAERVGSMSSDELLELIEGTHE